MTDTVYVVYWSGDEDCDGRNDGPISVHIDRDNAVAAARVSAEDEAAARRDRRETYNATNPTQPWSRESIDYIVAIQQAEAEWYVQGERCSCAVVELAIV